MKTKHTWIDSETTGKVTRVTKPEYIELKSCANQSTPLINSLHLSPQPRSSYRHRRAFNKGGEINLTRVHVEQRGCRYLKDFFTTLLDLGWFWILSLLILSFVLSWLIFAGLWFLMMELHGDFSDHSGNSTWIPCVAGVKTLTGVILFSIETQQTIGYGTRSVTEQCATGVLLLAIQSCFGFILQALWAGIAYTKLVGPKNRRRTLIWSRQAVISLRDHYLTLQVRIADIRQKSNLLEAHVRMYYIAERLTQEQEIIPLDLLDMNVGFNTGRDRLLLQWPLTIEHRIDSMSPLWLMDKKQLAKASFEILVVFEGNIETTGLTTQMRISYMPNEIIWGARFDSTIRYDPNGGYIVDYAKFNSITPDCRTRDCSAKQLKDESEN